MKESLAYLTILWQHKLGWLKKLLVLDGRGCRQHILNNTIPNHDGKWDHAPPKPNNLFGTLWRTLSQQGRPPALARALKGLDSWGKQLLLTVSHFGVSNGFELRRPGAKFKNELAGTPLACLHAPAVHCCSFLNKTEGQNPLTLKSA